MHKFTDIFLHDVTAAILLNLTPLSKKSYYKSLLKHLLNAALACILGMWVCENSNLLQQLHNGSQGRMILSNWKTLPQPSMTKLKRVFHFSEEYLQYVWSKRVWACALHWVVALTHFFLAPPACTLSYPSPTLFYFLFPLLLLFLHTSPLFFHFPILSLYYTTRKTFGYAQIKTLIACLTFVHLDSLSIEVSEI